MRENFSNELGQLESDLIRMSRYVTRAAERARSAIACPDPAIVEEADRADEKIDQLLLDIDDMCVVILALESPVATDLRQVISTMRIAQTLERQGDLAQQTVRLTRAAHPGKLAPAHIQEVLEAMSELCVSLAREVQLLLENPTLARAEHIQDDNDRLDELHSKMRKLLRDDNIEVDNRRLVDLVLLDRFLARFGDHSTSVARRIIFLLTGRTATKH